MNAGQTLGKAQVERQPSRLEQHVRVMRESIGGATDINKRLFNILQKLSPVPENINKAEGRPSTNGIVHELDECERDLSAAHARAAELLDQIEPLIGKMHSARIRQSPRLQRVYKLLKSGASYTTRQIVRQAHVCAVSAIISELRDNNVMIDCQRKNNRWYYRIEIGTKRRQS